ncbi:Short-chain dehydrogenase/reductase SDR [Sesbania bispinosa]|nr:Short-chain dehydrogenase/reductase SDR [Sesbania bispinosa]
MAGVPNSINSDHKLAGKVAIITGGASGIGEETARLFANHGARMVVIADIQDDLGNQVAASIDEDQVKHLVESTINIHGQLDIMFSNAGILSPSDQTVLDLDFSEFDRLFAVNVRGMAVCVKHAARAMVKGHHAVLGLVRSASVQLGEHGIRVNCVSPSGLATPLTRAANGMETQELQKCYAQKANLKGVFLTPKHVADAVLFLASGDSGFVTGHDLAVDGGFIPA